MRSILFTVFATALMALSSCKKEKLEGDSTILIGKWRWTETYQINNACDHDSLWNYILFDSATAPDSYEVEFYEKGKLNLYHNGGLINGNRIVFASKESLVIGPYEFKFVINTNNNPDKPMNIWVGQDSLLLDDFPKDTDGNCEEMRNHFIRG
jgi:hypothetical protein